MSYPSWEPRYRVKTVDPGKLDLFVITYINGVVSSWSAILDYDDAVAKARAFSNEHQCHMMVLPMTGPEFWNFMGWKPKIASSPGNSPSAEEASDRKLAVDILLQVLSDSNDTDARRDARDLLTSMGNIRI